MNEQLFPNVLPIFIASADPKMLFIFFFSSQALTKDHVLYLFVVSKALVSWKSAPPPLLLLSVCKDTKVVVLLHVPNTCVFELHWNCKAWGWKCRAPSDRVVWIFMRHLWISFIFGFNINVNFTLSQTKKIIGLWHISQFPILPLFMFYHVSEIFTNFIFLRLTFCLPHVLLIQSLTSTKQSGCRKSKR